MFCVYESIQTHLTDVKIYNLNTAGVERGPIVEQWFCWDFSDLYTLGGYDLAEDEASLDYNFILSLIPYENKIWNPPPACQIQVQQAP